MKQLSGHVGALTIASIGTFPYQCVQHQKLPNPQRPLTGQEFQNCGLEDLESTLSYNWGRQRLLSQEVVLLGRR